MSYKIKAGSNCEGCKHEKTDKYSYPCEFCTHCHNKEIIIPKWDELNWVGKIDRITILIIFFGIPIFIPYLIFCEKMNKNVLGDGVSVAVGFCIFLIYIMWRVIKI
jgi:hypothetical protein